MQHRFHDGRCQVCYQPTSVARWWRLESLGCPGVRWLRVDELRHYPYLATTTTLRSLKHKPHATQAPTACYYSKGGDAYRMLYDVRDAVPIRPTTEKQRAILDQARQLAQAARTCSWCHIRVRSKQDLRVKRDGHRLCSDCSRAWSISARVRSMLATPERYVILDTETTGLDAWGGDEIVELAVLGLDGSPRLDTLIRPRRHIPSHVVAIHGITDDMVQDAPTFAEVYAQLAAALADRVVLVYNFDFDLSMVAAECERLGLPCPLGLDAGECMMQLYAQYVGDWSSYWHGYRWQSLPYGGHRAMGDCRAVLRLLHEIAGAAPPSPYPAPAPEAQAVGVTAAAAAAADDLPF